MFLLRSMSRVASFSLFDGRLVGRGRPDSGQRKRGHRHGSSRRGRERTVWAVAYIVLLLLVAAGVFATVRGSRPPDRPSPKSSRQSSSTDRRR